MTVLDFQRQLRETGSYDTPFPRRPLPRPLSRIAFQSLMWRSYIHSWLWSAESDFRKVGWPRLSFEVLRNAERSGGVVHIEGFRALDALGGAPAVVVCNHVSALETYFLPSILCAWNDVAYILKQSLLRYPIVGRCIRAIKPIPVTRKSPVADLRAVLKFGGEAIGEGRFAVIFPQGTRQRLFDAASFHSLGAKLARHAGVPLVPVAAATDFLRIGQWQRDLFATVHPESPIRFACGDPIPPDVGEGEMQRRAVEFITSTLSRWERMDSRRMLAGPAALVSPRADGR